MRRGGRHRGTRPGYTAAFASDNRWPDWVRITIGEDLDITSHSASFDLSFADAPGGKSEGLDVTIAAVRPGGHLLVDDMNPELAVDAQHEHETAEVRSQLHQHPGQASVEIAWSTGLILSTRRRQ